MAVRISDYTMSSTRSRHTARIAQGRQYAWEVSWLPGRHLNRDEAVTAMVIADTTASGDVRPGHQAWPNVQAWAAELGMTANQALDRTAGPPRWATQQKTAELPGRAPADPGPGIVPSAPERVAAGWIEDPDPIDLGWVDEFDWAEPEYPDPSWPGFGGGLRRAPSYLSDLAVGDWHADRHPDHPASPGHAFPAVPDPRPAAEPARLPDWEAGQ